MDVQVIVDARKLAEETVSDMPEGPLKTKAFEVIFERLLQERTPAGGSAMTPKVGKSPAAALDATTEEQAQRIPDSCPERILRLRDEGFFRTSKTLSEIRSELQMHGWTYPVTSISGPLQRLVQRRELRRMASADRKKGSYSYVAP